MTRMPLHAKMFLTDMHILRKRTYSIVREHILYYVYMNVLADDTCARACKSFKCPYMSLNVCPEMMIKGGEQP